MGKKYTIEGVAEAVIELYVERLKAVDNEDIAEYMDCSTSTVARLIRENNGMIPSVRFTQVGRSRKDYWLPHLTILAKLLRGARRHEHTNPLPDWAEVTRSRSGGVRVHTNNGACISVNPEAANTVSITLLKD